MCKGNPKNFTNSASVSSFLIKNSHLPEVVVRINTIKNHNSSCYKWTKRLLSLLFLRAFTLENLRL